jgi:signal transduction histidine kinase
VLIRTERGDEANRALREIVGCSDDEPIDWSVIERRLEPLDVRGDEAALPEQGGEESLVEALDADPAADARYRLTTPAGRVVILRLAARPLVRDERTVGTVILAIDETIRYEIERLRDAFLGVLGHELRTPMTSIVASAELLRSNGLDAPVRTEVATMLVDETKRLHELVDQLVSLAHLERGDVHASEPVHLVHVARRVATEQRRSHPKLQLTVTAEVPARSSALGDEGYIRQVLEILVENAARYAGSSAEVEIRIEAMEGSVTVHVLDDGPGLPTAGGDDLFRLFHRGPTSGSHSPQGIGIGLFVARSVVQAMGGRIWAESRPSGGADVAFSLPAAED